MMEKPMLPAWLVKSYWAGANKDLHIPIVIPNGSQAMDVYNALFSKWSIEPVYESYGWITNKGRWITGEAAALMALEANLLDKRSDCLTIQQYKGAYKE
jgi:hypothetical protein